jgi:hypothetical protein
MRLLFLLSLFFSQIGIAFSQGCSDAGFCTMGAMRPDQSYNKRIDFRLRSIEYNFYRGKSTTTAIIYAHTVEINASLGERNTIQFKLPYMHIAGNLGQNQGLGDISISATRALKSTPKFTLAGTVGTKIPTNKSNQTIANAFTNFEEKQLPMYYQTSLGTYDAIAGFSLINRKWLLAAGVQVALSRNANQFTWNDWRFYPSRSYLEKHHVGRNLRRGSDAMIRIERNFRFTNFNFSLGALPIYRFHPDEVDFPEIEQRVRLNKTTGLALSVLGSFGYQFSVRNGIKIIFGYKITDRKNNPDGLTRDNVISYSYIYRF